MQEYLRPSACIDFDHPLLAEAAAGLARDARDEHDLVQRCFEFVRDEIRHSWDYKQNPVTCRASDVLRHRTGYCYAKAHLLAALLRANKIPAGLCYQRIAVGESGPPYCLHGLNAVFLQGHGWYRIDARGNKPGVVAQFTPPREQLAFALQDANEFDLSEIFAEPLPIIVATLESCADIDAVHANLPDIPLS